MTATITDQLADHLVATLDRLAEARKTIERLHAENRDLCAQLDACTCTTWDDPARDALIASDAQDAADVAGGVFIR